MAALPPFDAASKGAVASDQPGFEVTNRGTGPAIEGISNSNSSFLAAGLVGINNNPTPGDPNNVQRNAAGVTGMSANGEGVHGETTSDNFAAVAGINKGPTATDPQGNRRNPSGVFGKSDNGEGVHGESNSNFFAAVAGIQRGPADPNRKLNPVGVFAHSDNGVGVHGETNSDFFAAIFGKGKVAGVFDGDVGVTGVLTVDRDVILRNGDCAEEFDIGQTEAIEPGSVVVLGNNGFLEVSERAYDKKVVGVVTGAGDLRPGIILDKRPSQNRRQAIALVGKVYCKVDARYAEIEVGDLLTTSDTPGHAMKAIEPLKAFGAVIGKALRPLEAGQGQIPILIALQ